MTGSGRVDIVVGVGDCRVTSDLQAIISTYALGSCLGITVWDPVSRVGGMLHAMLPSAKVNTSNGRRAMYVDTGMEDLINEVHQLGGVFNRLQLKVFGGAKVLQADQFFRIGDKNYEMLQSVVGEYGISPIVVEVGGSENRTIKFQLSSGRVKVRMPNKKEYYT